LPIKAVTCIAALLAALLLPCAAGAVVPNPGFESGPAGATATADHTIQIVKSDADAGDSSSAVERDNFSMVPEAGTLVLCAAGMLGLLVAGSRGGARGACSKLSVPSLRRTR
jgi:hypothetical protein